MSNAEITPGGQRAIDDFLASIRSTMRQVGNLNAYRREVSDLIDDCQLPDGRDYDDTGAALAQIGKELRTLERIVLLWGAR